MGDGFDDARADQLARRAKRGNIRARDELLASLDRYLVALVRRFYGADQDDLLQEARLGALRALGPWNPAGGMYFRTYATMYARGLCSRAVHVAAGRRAREVQLELETADGEELAPIEPSDDGAGAASMESEVDRAVMNRALNRLKWTESFVIRRRVAGDTLKEVGRGCRLSREQVRRMEPRLVDKLRRRTIIDLEIGRG